MGVVRQPAAVLLMSNGAERHEGKCSKQCNDGVYDGHVEQ